MSSSSAPSDTFSPGYFYIKSSIDKNKSKLTTLNLLSNSDLKSLTTTIIDHIRSTKLTESPSPTNPYYLYFIDLPNIEKNSLETVNALSVESFNGITHRIIEFNLTSDNKTIDLRSSPTYKTFTKQAESYFSEIAANVPANVPDTEAIFNSIENFISSATQNPVADAGSIAAIEKLIPLNVFTENTMKSFRTALSAAKKSLLDKKPALSSFYKVLDVVLKLKANYHKTKVGESFVKIIERMMPNDIANLAHAASKEFIIAYLKYSSDDIILKGPPKMTDSVQTYLTNRLVKDTLDDMINDLNQSPASIPTPNAAKKAEQARLEQEKAEQEKAEQERIERERLAEEAAERERIERERLEPSSITYEKTKCVGLLTLLRGTNMTEFVSYTSYTYENIYIMKNKKLGKYTLLSNLTDGIYTYKLMKFEEVNNMADALNCYKIYSHIKSDIENIKIHHAADKKLLESAAYKGYLYNIGQSSNELYASIMGTATEVKKCNTAIDAYTQLVNKVSNFDDDIANEIETLVANGANPDEIKELCDNLTLHTLQINSLVEKSELSDYKNINALLLDTLNTIKRKKDERLTISKDLVKQQTYNDNKITGYNAFQETSIDISSIYSYDDINYKFEVSPAKVINIKNKDLIDSGETDVINKHNKIKNSFGPDYLNIASITTALDVTAFDRFVAAYKDVLKTWLSNFHDSDEFKHINSYIKDQIKDQNVADYLGVNILVEVIKTVDEADSLKTIAKLKPDSVGEAVTTLREKIRTDVDLIKTLAPSTTTFTSGELDECNAFIGWLDSLVGSIDIVITRLTELTGALSENVKYAIIVLATIEEAENQKQSIDEVAKTITNIKDNISELDTEINKLETTVGEQKTEIIKQRESIFNRILSAGTSGTNTEFSDLFTASKNISIIILGLESKIKKGATLSTHNSKRIREAIDRFTDIMGVYMNKTNDASPSASSSSAPADTVAISSLQTEITRLTSEKDSLSGQLDAAVLELSQKNSLINLMRSEKYQIDKVLAVIKSIRGTEYAKTVENLENMYAEITK